MHAILAAFFAAIFSFCHASATQRAIDHPPVSTGDQTVFENSVSSTVATSQTAPVYAGGGCHSCLAMNVSYGTR